MAKARTTPIYTSPQDAALAFYRAFETQDIDVMCLQETKAQEHQLSDAVFRPAGYQAWFKDASTKKGYSYPVESNSCKSTFCRSISKRTKSFHCPC